MRFGFLFAVAALCGCVADKAELAKEPTAIAPYDPSNPGPWCADAGGMLNDPWLSDWQKLAVYDMMTNRGCTQ